MCCKRPSQREPSNFTMVHRYWPMCHLPFAISQLPTLIKKSCWPSFTSSVTWLARQDLPTPVEEKLVFIDVFEAIRISGTQIPAANSHLPLPKNEGLRAFLKDWSPSWQQLFRQQEKKFLTLSHDDIYVSSVRLWGCTTR